MSKELPYYQFEVAEYLVGDIMICSLEAQGLFSIIKCIYWQKECQLSTKQLLKRYDKQDLIDELIEEKCIKVDSDGNIEISFLLAQYKMFLERRNKLSIAGKKGGLKGKNKASIKPPLKINEATLKHIEERREEEKRIEKNREEEDVFYTIEILKNYYLKDEKLIEAILSNKSLKINSKNELEKSLEKFNIELSSKSQNSKTWEDYTAHFISWKRKLPEEKKEHSFTTNR